MPAHKIYSSESERRRAEYLRAKTRKPAPPPDPISLLTKVERAYIAGLIDGEGCIRIGHVGPKKLTFYPSVAVGMTNREVIEWLQSKIHSGSIKLNNPTSRRRNSKWKPQHIIRLHGKRACLLCASLLPFLIVKRAHAQVVARFPSEDRRGPGRGITREIQTARKRLRDEIAVLNRRG